LNIARTGAKYRADLTGDRAEPCPTPTSAFIFGDENSPHQYEVSLFTKYKEKNRMTLSGNPDLLRIAMSMPWFKEGKNCAMSNAIMLVLRPLAHPALTR
jgi:hypothetical protein